MLKRPALPVIVWAMIILFLSSFPGGHIPRFKFLSQLGIDKIVHGFMYMVFSFLLVNLFRAQKQGVMSRYPALFAIFLAAMYGILMELCQAAFFVQRSAEIGDAAANTAGAIIGAWAYYRIYLRRLNAKGGNY